MTQKEAKALLPIVQAYSEGKTKVAYCHTSPEVCEYIRATNTYSLRDKASAF